MAADLLLAIRIRRIDDVDEQIGVGHLLERRPERARELLRQIADEAHGVGDHDLALVREPQAAADRIERREQLVGGERVAFSERVEQRRLARVRVSADRDDRDVAIGAALAAQPAIVGEIGEPLLEELDAFAGAAAIDL